MKYMMIAQMDVFRIKDVSGSWTITLEEEPVTEIEKKKFNTVQEDIKNLSLVCRKKPCNCEPGAYIVVYDGKDAGGQYEYDIISEKEFDSNIKARLFVPKV